jgi:hypothetical protein
MKGALKERTMQTVITQLMCIFIGMEKLEEIMHMIDSMAVVANILDEKDVGEFNQPFITVMTTIVGTGGWRVDAFKAGTLGRLLRSSQVVVYKGMAYPIDVWE